MVLEMNILCAHDSYQRHVKWQHDVHLTQMQLLHAGFGFLSILLFLTRLRFNIYACLCAATRQRAYPGITRKKKNMRRKWIEDLTDPFSTYPLPIH